jgi:hypothetical protein
MTSDGDMRASDRDRDCAGAALREAYTAGRLDNDEFRERVDAAYAAKTWGDLRDLTADLPEGAAVAARLAAAHSYAPASEVAGPSYHETKELPRQPGRPFKPLWAVAMAWLIIAGVAHVPAAIPLVLLAVFILNATFWRIPPRRRPPRPGDDRSGHDEWRPSA